MTAPPASHVFVSLGFCGGRRGLRGLSGAVGRPQEAPGGPRTEESHLPFGAGPGRARPTQHPRGWLPARRRAPRPPVSWRWKAGATTAVEVAATQSPGTARSWATFLGAPLPGEGTARGPRSSSRPGAVPFLPRAPPDAAVTPVVPACASNGKPRVRLGAPCVSTTVTFWGQDQNVRRPFAGGRPLFGTSFAFSFGAGALGALCIRAGGPGRVSSLRSELLLNATAVPLIHLVSASSRLPPGGSPSPVDALIETWKNAGDRK